MVDLTVAIHPFGYLTSARPKKTYTRCDFKFSENTSLGREQVRRVFFANGQGTKHALAEILAKRFPEELGFRLPPKRRPWMSEDYRMDIFDAVALALIFFYSKKK